MFSKLTSTFPPISLVVKVNQTVLLGAKQKFPELVAPSAQPLQISAEAFSFEEKKDCPAQMIDAFEQSSLV